MQTVLETKGALVNAVVEGEAMAGDVPGDVLDELQRALRAISPGLADAPHRIEDDDLIERLLREASEDLRATGNPPRKRRPGLSPAGGDRGAPARARGALARAVGAIRGALSVCERVSARRRVRHHRW